MVVERRVGQFVRGVGWRWAIRSAWSMPQRGGLGSLSTKENSPRHPVSDQERAGGFQKCVIKMPAVKRSKTVTEIRSLARSHTRTALNILVGVMRNTKAPAPARIAAANSILDRGWGKATQGVETGDNGALELIHRIERAIVHPENVNPENPDSKDL
jgi:hypothetical protein